jgi:superfamily I DNA and/or RNA helicase
VHGLADEVPAPARGDVPGVSPEKLAEAWRRERRAAGEKLAAERRGRSLAERVEAGVALRDLAIDERAASPGGRTLVWLVPRRPRDLEHTRVGPGDPVRLWLDSPDEPEAVIAVAQRKARGRIGVVIDGEIPERLEDAPVFHLDRDDPQSTFDRGDRAIARLGAEAHPLKKILLGERAPAASRSVPWEPLDAQLNDAQRAAVGRALGAPELALVHGPPGTGKTRTLVEIVRQVVRGGGRVLATAASNTAVDNLAERLAAAGEGVVRLGHPARVSPAVEEHTLDAMLDADEASALARSWFAEASALRRKLSKIRDRAERKATLAEARQLEGDARRHLAGTQAAILARHRVICATAAGADALLLGELAFDLVVLDEATQCPDPIALVALWRAPRAVLAGDPCQLPPTVISGDPLLASTFFDRLRDEASLLVVQHRMHAEIMRFPSETMYGGKLVAAPEVAAHVLEDLGVAPDPTRAHPFVFVDTSGKGWLEERAPDDPSTANPGNAARVAAEARRLLARGLSPDDLAVITPYDAQARAIRDLLPGVEVGTVDGFQGREKEAILVDLVRANEDGELGFLADRRRMNVALTRARRFLLVLGDGATLGADPWYRAFVAGAEARGAWISAWSDDPE